MTTNRKPADSIPSAGSDFKRSFGCLLACAFVLFVLYWLYIESRWGGPQSRPATTITEFEQLSSALQAYKEAKAQTLADSDSKFLFPPSMSELVVADRKIHFMWHLQAAFTNANYGVNETHFDNLREALRAPDKLGTGSQPYTYKNARGEVALLDLNTLDPAEALVFWLGGFPTPCRADGSPIAPNQLFGFNKDYDNPFKRDSEAQEKTDPLRFRTQSYFEFKPERLVDNDDDGWLEYLPQDAITGTRAAPFVYFDAATYTAAATKEGVTPFDLVNLTGYPRHRDVTSPALASEWGLAVPLAKSFDPTGKTPLTWQHERTFQILAPGKDGKYSAPITGDLAAAMRITVFPTGDTYTKAGNYEAGSRTSYSIEELDNLTNLIWGTLDEARQTALERGAGP
jgi:hypothetical protein